MYLIDTNICIYLIKRHPPSVLRRFREHPLQDIKISSITVAELEYGASKSLHREQNRKAMSSFIAPFGLIDFTSEDAEFFGVVRAALEKRGTPIGPYDLMLAAQALRNGLIFVTNNEREFIRVPGLQVENWAE
jgi:tRNA(fMet)-specific endonuclease VapC